MWNQMVLTLDEALQQVWGTSKEERLEEQEHQSKKVTATTQVKKIISN